MRPFLPFLFLLFPLFLTSQQLPEFAPVGAKWHYGVFDFGPQYFTYQYEVSRNDTILGQPCKYIDILDHYFYQDSLKIWSYTPSLNDWSLWFDFSADVDSGWTWYWDIPFQGRDTVDFTVFRKGDTLINGINLPYLEVIMDGRSWCTDFGRIDGQDTITFRITWSLGPAYNGVLPSCVTDPSVVDLVCYEDSIIGQYYAPIYPGAPCDTSFYLSNTQPLQNNFSFSPNPATQRLRVSLQNPQPSQVFDISITDLQGRRLRFWDKPFQESKAELSVEGLAPGCYLVQLLEKGQLLASKKLLVVGF
jgi:hypothetical protein